MAKGNGELKMLEALKALGEKLDGLRSDLRGEMGLMRAELNGRLDRLIENTGAHWRDLEKRVAALEDEAPTR